MGTDLIKNFIDPKVLIVMVEAGGLVLLDRAVRKHKENRKRRDLERHFNEVMGMVNKTV